jgi:hypothetical protein
MAKKAAAKKTAARKKTAKRASLRKTAAATRPKGSGPPSTPPESSQPEEPMRTLQTEVPTSPIGGPAAMTPPALLDDPHVDPRPLPESYGKTRLTLLVRDPEWFFCYWDISPETRREFDLGGRGDGEKMVLRLYDVTGVDFDGHNANAFHDVPLTRHVTSWYVRLGEPNRTWSADLGLLDEQGLFQPIVRSNTVTAPPPGVSDRIDDRWMAVDEERFAQVLRLSGAGQAPDQEGSEALGPRSAQRLLPQYLLGASEQFAGGSEQLASHEIVRGEEPAPFHLQVDYELVVYGSTDPDASLSVCGQPAALRPDGSFTVRFALPDGRRRIEVQAAKGGGAQSRRSAATVSKKTA